MVSIVVQNLVEIDALVSITWIFCPFGLKTPIHAHKIGVLGVFHPQNGKQCQRNPQKGTSLRESASFEPSSVKIRRRVWPVGEFMKKGINKKISLYFTHFPRSPPSTDLHQIWRSRRGRRRNHLYQIFWWSVKGCLFCGGRKLSSPIDKASRH